MTACCLAPTPQRPLTSVRRLVTMGALGGLVLGGPLAAVILIVAAVVGAIGDPFDWSASYFPGAVVTLLVIIVFTAGLGGIIGVLSGLAAVAGGRMAGGRRWGVAVGAFVAAAFLSWWPLEAITADAPAVAVPLTAVAAGMASWLMATDRFPGRRVDDVRRLR